RGAAAPKSGSSEVRDSKPHQTLLCQNSVPAIERADPELLGSLQAWRSLQRRGSHTILCSAVGTGPPSTAPGSKILSLRGRAALFCRECSLFAFEPRKMGMSLVHDFRQRPCKPNCLASSTALFQTPWTSFRWSISVTDQAEQSGRSSAACMRRQRG